MPLNEIDLITMLLMSQRIRLHLLSNLAKVNLPINVI